MKTSKKVCFEELYPIIKDTLSKGDTVSFCAFGTSMLPFIRNGKDLVTLGPAGRDLSAGDIIFYRRNSGQFVLHRIVKVHPEGVYDLCGDNQFAIEKGICQKQVIGKMVGLQRNEKNVALHSLSAKIWFCFLPTRRFLLHVKSAIARRIKGPLKK